MSNKHEPIGKIGDVPVYECDVCGQRFLKEKAIGGHDQVHEEPEEAVVQ